MSAPENHDINDNAVRAALARGRARSGAHFVRLLDEVSQMGEQLEIEVPISNAKTINFQKNIRT
jgi:hypothetical protein